MANIFKTINPNENIILSELNTRDLIDFLYLINSYYLEYREMLGISDDVTFGLEIECDKLGMKKAQNIVREKNASFFGNNYNDINNWQVTTDLSLKHGCEITSPILTDEYVWWNQVKEICDTLAKYGKIKRNAGAHVHIGANIIHDDVQKLWHFLKLWEVYEPIIYRFCYGEYLNARQDIKTYAYPIASILKSQERVFQKLASNPGDLQKFFDYLFKLLHRQPYNRTGRNEALNFNNVKDFHSTTFRNTIEFRCPNGTLNPIIWQNNVNLFAHMLLSTQNIDEEFLKSRDIDALPSQEEFIKYQDIYLYAAVEFCDLVFNCNIDKVYFLRQYLKGFEVCDYQRRTLKKAKPFTMK